MGRIKKKEKVKLIIGFIFQKESVFERTKRILKKRLGEIDFESELLDFVHTNYYNKELGEGLKRKFLSFSKLINPSSLVKIRYLTQRLEKKISLKGNRQVNIDPGYIDLSKLVLATTKDYKHRIYLKDGIYVEVTLHYEGNDFKAFPWTYPDYKSPQYSEIFKRIRQIYKDQIKKGDLRGETKVRTDIFR